MEQIHKGGMSRYKKVASNSQYGSNRDKLYLTGVVVTCTGMMCSMDKVGEAVDVSYFVLAWSLTVSRMGQSRMALPEWMHHNLAEKSSWLSRKA